MAEQRPPRGRPRSETARTRILAAARALLEERGLPGLTVEGIAARAGVGKPTIYRHWPNAQAVAMDAFSKARSLIASRPGGAPLELVLGPINGGSTPRFRSRSLKLNPDEATLAELQRLFGKGHVRLVRREAEEG